MSVEIKSEKYRSIKNPRSATVIQRTSSNQNYGGSSGGSGGNSRSKAAAGMNSLPSMPTGSYAQISSLGVQSVKGNSEKGKKDLQDLNGRFATYIEKVRFLEAQNRKLADELEKLKSKWGKETTAIKCMYQAELDEARKLLDDAEKEKGRLEIRCTSFEELLEELHEQVDDMTQSRIQDRDLIESQNETLADYGAEVNILRQRVEQLQSDHEKDRKEIARLADILTNARVDLDNETLAHIDAENRRQTLEEEIAFLKLVHEQELREISALILKDTNAENKDFWKHEMTNALQEIQATYDEKMEAMRGELEKYYNMKVQEFRTGATKKNMDTVHAKEESKRLRADLTAMRSKLSDAEARNNQLTRELELLRADYSEKEREWENERNDMSGEIARLRAEMEAILNELQNIMDTKLGLELEIASYRKLLEGEENRIGLKSVVETMFKQTSSNFLNSSNHNISIDNGAEVINDSQIVKGEMSAKTTYQRSAKGPVSILECSGGGNYITLENNSRKDAPLENWSIKRVVDGVETVNFIMPREFVFKGSTKLRIWSKGEKDSNGEPNDLEGDFNSWGIGANITTKLINTSNEDRATHIQKTIYTS